MNEKGYLKATPIRNILRIGIGQYDEWVAEGFDPNEPLEPVKIGPELAAELTKRGLDNPNALGEVVELGIARYLQERERTKDKENLKEEA